MMDLRRSGIDSWIKRLSWSAPLIMGTVIVLINTGVYKEKFINALEDRNILHAQTDALRVLIQEDHLILAQQQTMLQEMHERLKGLESWRDMLYGSHKGRYQYPMLDHERNFTG